MSGARIRLPGRDVSLFVRSLGAGPPVLVMHGGLGADHSTMLALAPLADRHRLIFYDHRCNGRSQRLPLQTLSWENLAEDARALREHFGIQRWAVVGHSFGAMVALEYALRHPGELSRLCLLDGGADSFWPQKNAPALLARRGAGDRAAAMAAAFYNGAVDLRQFKGHVVALARHYYARPSLGLLLAQAFRALRVRPNGAACRYGFKNLLAGWSRMDQLGDIAFPVQLIAGSADFLFPPEHQRAMAQGLPDARLALVDGAGHNAHMQKPHAVLAALRAFLEPEIQTPPAGPPRGGAGG